MLLCVSILDDALYYYYASKLLCACARTLSLKIMRREEKKKLTNSIWIFLVFGSRCIVARV